MLLKLMLMLPLLIKIILMVLLRLDLIGVIADTDGITPSAVGTDCAQSLVVVVDMILLY